ncbi:MAG TPA: OmpA family protein [Acetobacteraceae bacterium]|nr:OmpA family protein [Acetobacteraceae bacterium]
MTGATGEQGSSLAGPAGPTGAVGPEGIQGVAGSTGAEGPSRVGPTGPVGARGATGAQGATGDTGAQGNAELAGVAGPIGRTGAAGPQGAIGQTGAQGPGGPAGSWTPFRAFWFGTNSSNLRSNDSGKASDVASYLSQNPGQQVGIDGSMDPNNTDLSNARVSTVRDALLQAGVPAYKIQTGAFGNPQQQRDNRVEVLVSSQ